MSHQNYPGLPHLSPPHQQKPLSWPFLTAPLWPALASSIRWRVAYKPSDWTTDVSWDTTFKLGWLPARFPTTSSRLWDAGQVPATRFTSRHQPTSCRTPTNARLHPPWHLRWTYCLQRQDSSQDPHPFCTRCGQCYLTLSLWLATLECILQPLPTTALFHWHSC